MRGGSQRVAKGTEVEHETLKLTDENKLLSVQARASAFNNSKLNRLKGLGLAILSGGPGRGTRRPRGNREFNHLSGFYGSRSRLMNAQQALGGGATTLTSPAFLCAPSLLVTRTAGKGVEET